MKNNKKDSVDKLENLQGCFFTIEFKNLTIEDKKKLLIFKNIYEIEDLPVKINLISDSNQTLIEGNLTVGEKFTFSGEVYCISEQFLKQLFEHVKMEVKSCTEHLIKIRITNIQSHSKHIETFGNVNDFYKEVYEQHFDEIKKNEDFLTYNDPDVWHYNDWEHFVTESISSDFEFIEAYLVEEYVNSSKYEICKSWEKLHFHTEILNYLKSKIVKNQVLNHELKNSKSTLSMKVFIDDGEEIFNYILKTYEHQLNPSFFSYLYDYLNTKLYKIRTKGADSKKYRDYVAEVSNIEMSRIIYSDVTLCQEKTSMFDLFDIYISDYLTLKINE